MANTKGRKEEHGERMKGSGKGRGKGLGHEDGGRGGGWERTPRNSATNQQ